MCIINLVFFKLSLCLFIYLHPLYFSLKLFFPKLVLFFLFLQQGGKVFFNLCGSQGELLLFIGRVVSIFYRIELFCVPLIFFFFSLILYCVCLLFNELFLSIHNKKGEIQMKCGNPVCFVYGEIHGLFMIVENTSMFCCI